MGGGNEEGTKAWCLRGEERGGGCRIKTGESGEGSGEDREDAVGEVGETTSEPD